MRAFLEQEPIPGIEFEYKIASTFLPTVTAGRSHARCAASWSRRQPRRPRRRAGEERRAASPTEATLRTAIAQADKAPVERWTDATGGPRAGREAAGARQGRRRAATVPEIGATVLTLSNGVEVWLKPTDFKNDQVVVHRLCARRHRRWRRKRTIKRRRLATALVGVGGMGGLSPVDLEQAAGRQDRAGVADRSASTRTASTARHRRRISRRRCS